jgi:hypothetical protein
MLAATYSSLKARVKALRRRQPDASRVLELPFHIAERNGLGLTW